MKVYGITFKNVKTFTGMEGYGLNADVYIDNKKVGFALDEGCGGCVDIDFISNEARAEFIKRGREYFKRYPRYIWTRNLADGSDSSIVEDFFNELYNSYYEIEKCYKRFAKKGYPVTVVAHHASVTKPWTSDDYRSPDVIGCRKWDEAMEKQIIEEYKPVEYFVFRSLDDFIVNP